MLRIPGVTTTTYSSTGRLYGKATVEGASSCVPLAEGLAPGPHTVTVQKRTEAEQGRTTLYGIEADGALLDLPPPRRG